MNSVLLLLLDSRAPAGGHNHSAGMEAAIASGLVAELADVDDFCRLRLRTQGHVAAAFAAAACALWSTSRAADGWDGLDAELDARTPSEATRDASRQLGRGLVRLVRAMLPDFASPWSTSSPHHPIVLGAAVAAAGGTSELAARAAALNAIAAPASAAVRLLGLDPFAVQTMLARLAAEQIDPSRTWTPSGDLPADSAPVLDLLADVHLTAEVRLFAS